MSVSTFQESISREMSGVPLLVLLSLSHCFLPVFIFPYFFPQYSSQPVIQVSWENKIKRVSTRKMLVYLLYKSLRYFESWCRAKALNQQVLFVVCDAISAKRALITLIGPRIERTEELKRK